MPRKYSDTKYDNPEYEAKIEQQTLNVIQSLTKDDDFRKQEEPKVNASNQKKKNVLGLDFEIPDELSQLIAIEMKGAKKGNWTAKVPEVI